MKEEIYGWIRSLAVFYILLTTMIHLAPNGKYERYIRFFMGLLLILMLSAPVFAILGKSGELAESFRVFYRREESGRTLREMENLQKMYLEESCGEEIARWIRGALQKNGIETAAVKVNIEGEKLTAVLYMKEEPDQEQRGRIEDELVGEWGIGKGEYQIKIMEYQPQTVGGTASSGAASGSDRHTGVR